MKMNLIMNLAIQLAVVSVIMTMVSSQTFLSSSSSSPLTLALRSQLRGKRGLSDFFKRFWNIRKKINYFPFQQQSSSPASPVYPSSLGQDYLLSQAASTFYPIYQLSPAASPLYPSYHHQQTSMHSPSFAQYSQQSQSYGSEAMGNGNQINQLDYQQHSTPYNQQQQQQQPSPYGHQQPNGSNQQLGSGNFYYPQTMSGNNAAGAAAAQQPSSNNIDPMSTYSQSNYNNQQSVVMQQEESSQKPSYYYPPPQQQIGTSPYTFHSNPSQANTFHSRPYGSNPGTIDVHQVLDQFIRSAGLSPQGDHDNANKDRSYSDDKALSVKKLYSYPFYFSSSGDRPTSPIRRQSLDEGYMIPSPSAPSSSSIKRISQPSLPSGLKMEPMMSNAIKPHPQSPSYSPSSSSLPSSSSSSSSVASASPTTFNEIIANNNDESQFIAKNAAALQDFLANKVVHDSSASNTGNNNIEQMENNKNKI